MEQITWEETNVKKLVSLYGCFKHSAMKSYVRTIEGPIIENLLLNIWFHDLISALLTFLCSQCFHTKLFLYDTTLLLSNPSHTVCKGYAICSQSLSKY